MSEAETTPSCMGRAYLFGALLIDNADPEAHITPVATGRYEAIERDGAKLPGVCVLKHFINDAPACATTCAADAKMQAAAAEFISEAVPSPAAE